MGNEEQTSTEPRMPTEGLPTEYTGFLVLRLKPGILGATIASLEAAAKQAGRQALVDILDKFKLTSRPLVTSVNFFELERIEREALGDEFEPLQSLSAFWLLDIRHAYQQLEEIETALQNLPEVDLIYRERTPSDPTVNPDANPYAQEQKYFNAAPVGIDARWVWTLPNGDGAGMHFVDLEQGWLPEHEDLRQLNIIFNENRHGAARWVGDHGSAVLGVVAGIDNTKGIIGIAPNVASVRAVSHWNADTGQLHAYDALLAAMVATPRPHVLLLEVHFFL